MTSADGRFVISFNGEIYNHLSVRKDLEECARAPKWRGNSDTETILAAFAAWGVGEALPRLRGMFAFALWDKQRRCLCLARDRVGEKPLYYGWLGTVFVFGSELKALRRHPAWTGELDQERSRSTCDMVMCPRPTAYTPAFGSFFPVRCCGLTRA